MKDEATHLKQVFDKFLKDNNAFDAWYERYRLDNLIYNDEVPIETFFDKMSTHEKDTFYSGIEGTCMSAIGNSKEIIEKNKKCDILDSSRIIELDDKWMSTYKSLLS